MKVFKFKSKSVNFRHFFISIVLLFTLISNVFALPIETGTPDDSDHISTPQSTTTGGQNNLSSAELIEKNNALADMAYRQSSINEAFAAMKARVDALLPTDTRRDSAKELLDQAKTAVNIFINVPADDTSLDINPYRSNESFNALEKNAITAISNVNEVLFAPSRPGSVPVGKITEDFIPYIIRLLFRFAYFAIFVSFIVSGVMFVMAYSAEERVTSAKQILYFTLVGAALVTLAFAIVKAITNINFFGFI